MNKENKKNRLFFFDIDETLIMENIEPCFTKISELIKKAKINGDIFGLATSRPWETSLGIYRKLNLDGPGIFENGVYYKLNKDKEKLFVDDDFQVKIENFLGSLKNYLKPFKNITFIVSDEKKILKDKNYGSLIFISQSRMCSLSLYARKNGKINNEFLNDIYIFIKNNNDDFKIKKDEKFGKIYISHRSITKISTINFVLQKYYRDYEVFLISDNEDMDDYKNNINLCAVKNAHVDFKKRSCFIADKKGIDGVCELISRIIKFK